MFPVSKLDTMIQRHAKRCTMTSVAFISVLANTAAYLWKAVSVKDSTNQRILNPGILSSTLKLT